MQKTFYGPEQMEQDISTLAALIRQRFGADKLEFLVAVPRGGVPVAMALGERFPQAKVVSAFTSEMHPANTIVVDDIVDSGKTRNKFRQFLFATLHCKKDTSGVLTANDHENTPAWVHYWFEGEGGDINDSVIRQLEYIGEDVEREGLIDTPSRVVRSWETLYGGYKMDPKELITSFKEGACDEMVILKDIEFYSTCEHHMLPFVGRAHIAYLPGGKVLGVSKLARLLDVYARRLQIQERIGQQVTEFLMEECEAVGAACILEAQHLCMTSRGVQKQNSVMQTSSLRGVFKTDASARAELMSMIK